MLDILGLDFGSSARTVPNFMMFPNVRQFPSREKQCWQRKCQKTASFQIYYCAWGIQWWSFKMSSFALCALFRLNWDFGHVLCIWNKLRLLVSALSFNVMQIEDHKYLGTYLIQNPKPSHISGITYIVISLMWSLYPVFPYRPCIRFESTYLGQMIKPMYLEWMINPF